MLPPYEHNICNPESTLHYPQTHYQRIGGRLQRIGAVLPNVTPQTIEKHFPKENQCRHYSYCISGLIAILLCIFLARSIFPYPLHASCTVKWKFREPCSYAIQRLRWQIIKWSSSRDYGARGCRCLYSLKDSTNNYSITATRISSNLESSSEIIITFVEGSNKSCTATGKSKSNEWLMMFDYGSNYCNLRNLVEGANFVTDHGFVELTTDSICTQLNMVVCK